MNSPKKLSSWLAIAILCCQQFATADLPPPLPNSIKNLYEDSPNWQVSDNFGSLDWNKWTHRVHNTPSEWGTGFSYVKIINSSYLSVKGNFSTNTKGSGIGARNSSKYGFYVTRWRYSGSLTGWHASVWTAAQNFGYAFEAIENYTNINRLEIDIFERNSANPAVWNAVVHGWGPNGVHEAKVLRPKSNEWQTWTIEAVEYHPDYVRAWSYRNGAWQAYDKIFFNSSSSGNNLHTSFRKELYAIISVKKGVKGIQFPNADGWLHVDYYYVYDLK